MRTCDVFRFCEADEIEMLPTLMVNMEGCSNNLNNNTSIGFSSLPFDESVIINSVRNRKKNSELPNCPVCSCTIRQGELESHLCLEVERLSKISNGGNKRKLSQSSNLAMPGSSSSDTVEETIDVTGGTGSDVFQRVHANRLRRLCTRNRRVSPTPTVGQCPVCNTELPTGRLQRHALRCLKRTGAIVDEDVPDSSDEEFNIDVENDEPQSSGFGAEYEWCGLRIRASALQPDAVDATAVRRASHDTALVVDGDEDAELYGMPQYSPSRIEQVNTNVDENEAVTTNNVADQIPQHNVEVEANKKCNGLVEASAETRIQALKAKIKELETKGATESKCLICIGPYTSPAVSIQCWHVHCEVCWLDSLRAKKICPQCNAITTTQHLRRIYM